MMWPRIFSLIGSVWFLGSAIILYGGNTEGATYCVIAALYCQAAAIFERHSDA